MGTTRCLATNSRATPAITTKSGMKICFFIQFLLFSGDFSVFFFGEKIETSIILFELQYQHRKSQEKQSLSALKTAKESGDVDAEIKAQDALASVKAESLVAQQYKMRAESDSDKRKVKSKPKTETPTSVVADRKALEWQKRNEWFGSTTTKDRIMTQAAMVIHKELVDEGD